MLPKTWRILKELDEGRDFDVPEMEEDLAELVHVTVRFGEPSFINTCANWEVAVA